MHELKSTLLSDGYCRLETTAYNFFGITFGYANMTKKGSSINANLVVLKWLYFVDSTSF